MKAFLVKKPGDYGLTEVSIPEVLDDEVLVRVGAAAICHSDLDILQGRRTHKIDLPNIIGHEFAGTIEACGKSVAGLDPGDTVTCECMIWCGSCRPCSMGKFAECDNFSELGTMRSGAFAEYVAVPARLVHKFDNIPMEWAAISECAGNSLKAVELSSIFPGDNVVVIGPGPIGLFAVQLARLKAPERVICVGTRDERLICAKRMGATDVFNINTQDACAEIMKLTGGKGADAVIQCATTDSAFEMAVAVAGKGCRVVIEGLSSSGKSTPLDFDQFVIKPMQIIGANGANAPQMISVLHYMKYGLITPEALITHVLPLDEINKGIRMLSEKTSGAVKVVIKPH